MPIKKLAAILVILFVLVVPHIAQANTRSDPYPVQFIYLRGLSTQLPNTDAGFYYLSSYLNLSHYWSYIQMHNYSYNGGYVQDGLWTPFSYGCVDTGKGVEASWQVLDSMLQQMSAANPENRFVLVGHSFGGLVAAWHLIRARFFGDPLRSVAGVVTIDSPLHGVSDGKITTMNLFTCVGGSQSTNDLTGLYNQRSLYANYWQSAATWAEEQGVKVVTVGNQNDCFYWPNIDGCPDYLLTWEDNRYSQYIPGFERMYEVPIQLVGDAHVVALWAHSAVHQVWPYFGAVGEVIHSIGLLAVPPSPTPSPTLTPSPTGTPTSTVTPTPTLTPTATRTSSNTPVPISTFPPTVTRTPTPTPTATPSVSPTPAVVGIQVGWNLISPPASMAMSYTASSLLADMTVQGIDAIQIARWQHGQWNTHIRGFAFGDFTLEPNRGYFVRANGPGSWRVGN